jgi:hypothetical protein
MAFAASPQRTEVAFAVASSAGFSTAICENVWKRNMKATAVGAPAAPCCHAASSRSLAAAAASVNSCSARSNACGELMPKAARDAVWYSIIPCTGLMHAAFTSCGRVFITPTLERRNASRAKNS